MTSNPAASIGERAHALLQVLAGPEATLRPAQLAAIEAVVGDRRRALVVQRTGFGKSAVYFIATKLLRDQGAGPALVVSRSFSSSTHRVLGHSSRLRAADGQSSS